MEVDDTSHESGSGIHTQKKNWLITYTSSNGEQISIKMLKELGDLTADECHITSDQVMSYTYVHLIKRVRQPALVRFMHNAKLKHGITLNEIFGYDPISNPTPAKDNESVEQHIAFRMLVNHANTGNPSFKPCTDGEPVLTRGLLFKSLEIQPTQQDLAHQTKAQLIKYIKQLEKIRLEHNELKESMAALSQYYKSAVEERSHLRLENSEQKRTIRSLQARLGTNEQSH
jgi:hypothetical protein